MTQSQALTRRQNGMTTDQVDLIKRTYCKGATDDELALFIQIAQRTGLDIFARQIFAVKRKEMVDGQWRDSMTTQVSIDGFRLLAQRSKKYAGQMGPYWCGPDGEWRDVWLDSKPPAASKVAVLHADFAEPLVAVAIYTEYVQKKRDGAVTKMWAEKPALMLAKCAESLALRKAFPAELSGLYTPDEYPEVIEGEIVEERPRSAPRQIAAPREAPMNELEAVIGAQSDALEDADKMDLMRLTGLGGSRKKVIAELAGNYGDEARDLSLLLERLRAEEQGIDAAKNYTPPTDAADDVRDAEVEAERAKQAAEFDAYARAGGEPHRESRRVPEAKPTTLGTGVAEAAQPQLATDADEAVADRLRDVGNYGDAPMPTPTRTGRKART